MERKARDIGLNVTPPDQVCTDELCPFHGKLPVRGQVIEGTVVSTKMMGSVVVEKEHKRLIKKYERYITKTSRYLAHLPPCIKKKKGDKAVLAECRPISKNISFVVIQ